MAAYLKNETGVKAILQVVIYILLFLRRVDMMNHYYYGSYFFCWLDTVS